VEQNIPKAQGFQPGAFFMSFDAIKAAYPFLPVHKPASSDRLTGHFFYDLSGYLPDQADTFFYIANQCF